ncbi:MFS transporter [Piscinibacter gummiphilus]|uniref:MFS transporter n=1 Tax=Piscinibacter gummiphilus TaxID=946333 RepID=A0A1W6LE98_9BURK|nr:MFS transporter [Piscinibacter gummiphilus]ARN22559.1 MFS transporter [Piscinibacter gummiphilus]ATU67257.1 MFS transporter [Piscinibacter gummiphilus]GLS98151.1 MFS transporter [Piscinibacter gummiphilus]
MSTSYQPARAWTIASLLALMMTTNFLDKVVIGLVAVPMMQELDLTPTEFGLLGGSFYWLFALGAVVGGFISNRVPARRVLLVMALAWALIQLPLALSGSFLAFVVCRALLGLMEGPASPVATHALYKWFPNDRRSLPVALLHQGSSAGLLIAGLVIPVVTAHWGWRANFYLLTALGALWCLAWFAFGAEGQVETPATTQAEPRVPYARLLTDPTVLGNFAAHFVAHWVLAASLTWLNRYFQTGLGFEPIQAGRMFALFILVTAPVSLGLAWFSQVLMARGMASRHARGAFVGLALIASGLLNCALQWIPMSNLEKFFTLAVAGGLMLTMNSIGPAILGEIVPRAQRGGILAIGNAVASLGGLAAPVVMGWLIQRSGGVAAHGYEQGFFVGGLLLVAGGLIGIATMNPQRSSARLAPAALERAPA